MLHNLTNLTNWFLFCFFVVGSAGGLVYFVRLMFWEEKRTEIHHRYYQMPVYYGHDGRAGDMAQHEDPEGRPAA